MTYLNFLIFLDFCPIFINQNILHLSYFFSYKDIDRGFLEIYGPFGLKNHLKEISEFFVFYQTGNIFHYIFVIFFVLLSALVFLVEIKLGFLFY